MKTPLYIICMDGLDPDFAKEVGCSLPYECELSIPSECYSLGFPWTPHVWGSMFTGRIEKYPNSFLIRKDREKTFWMDQIRIPIRQFIKNKVGISWKRKGFSVNTSQEREEEKLEFNNTDIGIFKWLPPVINDSIFHKNHSYTYMIPAISDGYLYGGGNPNSILFDKNELNMVSNLAGYLLRSNYELVGLYARILDHMGHWGLNKKEEYYHVIKETYERVFSIANALQPNVVLVSDHGCLSGEHTHKAYFGSGVPVEGKSILDVCSNIEAILVKNK